MFKRVGSSPTILKMKLIREKRIRGEFVQGGLERLAGLMVRTVTGERTEEKRK